MVYRVLLVDDDEDLQCILKNALEIEGYEVLLANNGQEALDILAQKNTIVNCIILDLMMPIMDGQQFMKRDPFHIGGSRDAEREYTLGLGLGIGFCESLFGNCKIKHDEPL